MADLDNMCDSTRVRIGGIARALYHLKVKIVELLFRFGDYQISIGDRMANMTWPDPLAWLKVMNSWWMGQIQLSRYVPRTRPCVYQV